MFGPQDEQQLLRLTFLFVKVTPKSILAPIPVMLNAFHDWRTTNSTRDMRFVGIDSTDRDLELKFETFDNLFLVLS